MATVEFNAKANSGHGTIRLNANKRQAKAGRGTAQRQKSKKEKAKKERGMAEEKEGCF